VFLPQKPRSRKQPKPLFWDPQNSGFGYMTWEGPPSHVMYPKQWFWVPKPWFWVPNHWFCAQNHCICAQITVFGTIWTLSDSGPRTLQNPQKGVPAKTGFCQKTKRKNHVYGFYCPKRVPWFCDYPTYMLVHRGP